MLAFTEAQAFDEQYVRSPLRRSEMRVSLQDLEDSLTASAAHLCCEVLQGVSGVKQVLATYRMTDRPAPTEPSVYVDGSLAALGCFAFEAGVPKGLSSETTGRWVRASLGLICECYAHLCLDVLESARKTAAGLGLIKTRRKKPTGMSDAAAPLSDLDKISAQLHLDVQHFGMLCSKEYDVQPDSIGTYSKLLQSLSEQKQQQ